MFIGYTNEAMHQKAKIFSDSGPNFYDRIFNQRLVKHAYELEFEFSETILVNLFKTQIQMPKDICVLIYYINLLKCYPPLIEK